MVSIQDVCRFRRDKHCQLGQNRDILLFLPVVFVYIPPRNRILLGLFHVV